ncbi:MAG: hypothetical protein L0L22_11230 [Staphylococcus equorum]|nr:hypothetical protein [Staphylococcus equorum]
MERKLISSGSTFEKEIGHSRAVADGETAFASGTTGHDYTIMEISDNVIQQTDQTIGNIESALVESCLQDAVKVTYILPESKDADQHKENILEHKASRYNDFGQLADKIEIEVTLKVH